MSPRSHAPSRRAVRRPLAQRPAFQYVTIALVLAWSALTMSELVAPPGSVAEAWLGRLAWTLALVFVGELGLRMYAAPNRSRFFREYALDLVALASVPLGAVVAWPALRLLRLLRLLRVIALVRRLPAFTGFIRHKGPRRALALLGVVALAVIVATTALLAFEGGRNDALSSVDKAFWFSVFSIFATQPTPDEPVTLGGKLVSLFLIFVGLSTFAVMTGTVSAILVERLKAEGITVEWDELSDHLIICGWNRKAEIIVRAYADRHPDAPAPVVVIASLDGTPHFNDASLRPKVQFLDDDFTKLSALEKAGIARARTCVVLSDVGRGRTERDADARTVLTALMVERINPGVYTCAELNRREYAPHLVEQNSVNDFIVSGEHSAFLLAQAAMNHGTMNVWSDLLSARQGHKFCRIPVPRKLVGKSFTEALSWLKKHDDVLVIGVATPSSPPRINPGDVTLAEGDDLVVIAASDYEAG